MLAQEFMRNALLAGTFVALACGVCGWFVVLRGEVFAGDTLSHVAFPGALAAAVAGIDERLGLFAATMLAGAAIALAGRGVLARGGRRGGASGLGPADDATIGAIFTFVLALGVFLLTRFSLGSGGAAGIEAARTLFGSIFGLGAGEARLAAAIAAGATAIALLISRPLLFASVAPEAAAARGVPTRLLGVGFLMLLGVVTAEASQALGALLLLGLLTAPAAASMQLT
ncbi:MAG: metal ABC transporter permease, partial [Solirubrobacteraceae bacterium]